MQSLHRVGATAAQRIAIAPFCQFLTCWTDPISCASGRCRSGSSSQALLQLAALQTVDRISSSSSSRSDFRRTGPVLPATAEFPPVEPVLFLASSLNAPSAWSGPGRAGLAGPAHLKPAASASLYWRPHAEKTPGRPRRSASGCRSRTGRRRLEFRPDRLRVFEQDSATRRSRWLFPEAEEVLLPDHHSCFCRLHVVRAELDLVDPDGQETCAAENSRLRPGLQQFAGFDRLATAWTRPPFGPSLREDLLVTPVDARAMTTSAHPTLARRAIRRYRLVGGDPTSDGSPLLGVPATGAGRGVADLQRSRDPAGAGTMLVDGSALRRGLLGGMPIRSTASTGAPMIADEVIDKAYRRSHMSAAGR